ncbi:MAG: digeranylgeranylglycerophospholipid reductase [Halobacteriota archaeon]
MGDRHEIVIAGAGPAGAQCARDLAARGHDVLVLETEAEEVFPRTSNKSTAGTFPRMMAPFGVPDDVVMDFTDSVVLESPNDHYKATQPGAVLDFGAFKRWLVADGQAKGATYRFDARVTGPITEDEEVLGVTYNGDQEVYADIVIDATGPAAPIAKQLGVVDLRRENHAIGIEYEMEGIDVDPDGYADLTDAMMLRLDHDVAPGGYAWIFHTGGDTAKVGLCYIQNARHLEYAEDGLTVDGYLQRWIEADPRLEDAVEIEGRQQHRGSAHIQLPGRMSADSFMAIGDTVPSVDPVWGEGIHNCMESGRTAAIVAEHALTGTVDTSAETMALYDQLWYDRVAPNVDNRMMLAELLYLASNERYDRFMRDLNRLPSETLSRANQGDKRAMLRLLHLEDVPRLLKFAKERLGVGTGSRFGRPGSTTT